MANLEQSRQDSLDSIQEKLNSMATDTPLDNTKKAMDSLDWDDSEKEINIKKDFAEMFDILRDWNETEKELAKLELIVYLSQAGENIDSNKSYTYVVPFAWLPEYNMIVLNDVHEEHIDENNVRETNYTEYVFTNKWGKWYYSKSSRSSRNKIDDSRDKIGYSIEEKIDW